MSTSRRRAASVLAAVSLVLISLFATTSIASAANRAPSAPGLLSPTCCVDGNVRYSNHNDMTIWGSSTDPDGNSIAYRYKIFLFGSPAVLYNSGWHTGQPGWGFVAKVPESAPIRAGLTYVLTAQARDSHGALSAEVPFAYSVFSNRARQPTESADWYRQRVDLGTDRARFNNGLAQANNSYMASKLYNLALKPNDKCYNGDLPAGLRSQMITRDVGGLRNTTMLGAVMNSLQTVWREIEVKEPVLAFVVQSSGSLCYRSNRPAGTSVSNHSWGSAIDVNYGGGAPESSLSGGDASMYLYRLQAYFHNAGWYWGGGFSNQDNMHFEASQNLLDYALFLGILHHG